MWLPWVCWFLRLSIHTAWQCQRPRGDTEVGERRQEREKNVPSSAKVRVGLWLRLKKTHKSPHANCLFFLQQTHLAMYSVSPPCVLSFFLPFWKQGNKPRCYWLSSQFRRTSINKNNHTLGGSTQKTCVLSQHWRPEVQNQGVGGTLFHLKDLGRVCSLPLPVSGDPSIPWLVATSP